MTEKIAICFNCRKVNHGGQPLAGEKPVNSAGPTVNLFEGLCPACVAAKKQAEEGGADMVLVAERQH